MQIMKLNLQIKSMIISFLCPIYLQAFFSCFSDLEPSTSTTTSTFSNMSQGKRIKLSAIHEVLPDEIFVMILKKLDYKSLIISRGTCKKWRSVIDGFELLSIKNFCKFYLFRKCLLKHVNQQKSSYFQ